MELHKGFQYKSFSNPQKSAPYISFFCPPPPPLQPTALGGYFQAKVVNGLEIDSTILQMANSVATDAFASVRVCAAFGLQDKVRTPLII